jgi:hypothetical protein
VTTRELTVIAVPGWRNAIRRSLVSWTHRRAIRAEAIRRTRAANAVKHRAELEVRLRMEKELSTFSRDLDRIVAMQRLYRGL